MPTPGLRPEQVKDAITSVAGVALHVMQASPSASRTTTSSSYADIDANCEATINVPVTGTYQLILKIGGVYDAATGGCEHRYRILVDAAAVTTDDKRWEGSVPSGSIRENWSCQEVASLTAGSRTFKIQWKRASGTGTVGADTASNYTLQAILVSGSGAGGVIVTSKSLSGDHTGITSGTWTAVKDGGSGSDFAVTVTTFKDEVVFFGGIFSWWQLTAESQLEYGIGVDGADPVTPLTAWDNTDGSNSGLSSPLPTCSLPMSAGSHTFRIMVRRTAGSGSINVSGGTAGYPIAVLKAIQFRGGLNQPDTPRPRVAYNAAGAIDVVPCLGSTETRLTFQDGKQRSFSGTLAWAFANGVAELGLDTGSEAASTWYYLYAVPKSSDDAKITVRASTTSPVSGGPSGYTSYIYLGAFRNDGSSNILKFRQLKNKTVVEQQEVVSAAPTTGTSESAPGTSVSLTNFVPATAGRAYIDFYVAAASGDHWRAQLRDNSADQMMFGGELQAYRGASAELSYDAPLPTSTKAIYRRIFRNSGSGSNADWHIIWCGGWTDEYLD